MPLLTVVVLAFKHTVIRICSGDRTILMGWMRTDCML